MAEESADFRRRQRKGIARLKPARRIGPVELGLSELRPIDRRDDLALDRQASAQRLDIGLARNRALQMENEGSGFGQDWLAASRPAIVHGDGAKGPSYSPRRLKSSRPPATDLAAALSAKARAGLPARAGRKEQGSSKREQEPTAKG
jgi:hypothetical protein